MSKTKKSKQKVHRVSKECKYFKSCPFNWECLQEIKEHGFAVWSLELCYDLKELIDQGLVKESPTLEERKIAVGMQSLFGLRVEGNVTHE